MNLLYDGGKVGNSRNRITNERGEIKEVVKDSRVMYKSILPLGIRAVARGFRGDFEKNRERREGEIGGREEIIDTYSNDTKMERSANEV